MADISLIQDDPLDDCDEGRPEVHGNKTGVPTIEIEWEQSSIAYGGSSQPSPSTYSLTGVFEQGDGPSGGQLDVESFIGSVSPLVELQKYARSDNVFDRQMVPRVLREFFKNGPADAMAKDLPNIMDLVSKLAEEDETMVRTYIFEQVPDLVLVALDCSEQIPALFTILNDYLLPLIVRNLGDNDNQVRKTAQSTLFVLIENGLVSRQQAELQVCPTVLALSNVESLMDYHTGTVTLMSKLAPFLGSEVTERMFLMRFSELCSNDMFYVRKVCASHFGDFCAVVSKDAYEQTLLPCYLTLCSDDIWGVRKACAEVATSVSCPCPAGKRRQLLAPVFVKLLQDQSRWVRMSAFQTLGPFISTFAEPTISNLAYNSLGELVVVNNEGTEFRINPTYSESNMLSSVLYQFQERFNRMEDEQDYSQKDDNDDAMNLLGDTGDCNEIKIDNVALELIIGDDEETNRQSFIEPNQDNSRTEQITDSDAKEEFDKSALAEDVSSYESEMRSKQFLMEFLNLDIRDETGDTCSISNSIYGSECVKNVSQETTILTTENITLLPNSGNHITANTCSSVFCDKTPRISNGSGDNNCNVGLLKNEHCYVINENKVMVNSLLSAENIDITEQYNSFNYWYISPEMPLDEVAIDKHPVSIPPEFIEEKPQEHFIVMEHCDMLPSTVCNTELGESDTATVGSISSEESVTDRTDQCIATAEPPQYIVPQRLIDHFISMTDSKLAENTDKDLAYHCAYSLPAVALTLGKSNWILLKDTVEILAANIHYKVRRTVASSLHELAVILGTDLATHDLTPIFDEFIKDLDEVRIGVLKNLAHFLFLICQAKRNLYLPRLIEFLPAKNMSRANWRFREELAEQLLHSVTLFRPVDVIKHISYIAQELLCDQVAAVRESAILLITEIVRYVSKERHLTANFLVKIAEKFAHSTNWKRRQTFCLICGNLLMSNVPDLELFASDVMPHLLDLSWDPVPNVRLVVGKTVQRHIATNKYFFDLQSQHYDSIHSVLRRLQSDKDRDVRHSALTSKFTVLH